MLSIRDFRQKEIKNCLITNRAVTSLACPVVITRLWPDQPPMVALLSRFEEKKQQQNNTYNITTTKKYPLNCWWTVVKPPCSSARLIRPWMKYNTGAGRGHHGSYCYEATSLFFSFWRKSFIGETPSSEALHFEWDVLSCQHPKPWVVLLALCRQAPNTAQRLHWKILTVQNLQWYFHPWQLN